ncbi:MAG: HNH endonuclease [bacterium]
MTRKTIPKDIQLKIWFRDKWSCKYCGEPVFFAPTLKLLNELSPKHGYYHPNGKTDNMLSLFQWHWSSVDHVKPYSKGGEDNINNYVTACWSCNLQLKDKSHDQGKPQPDLTNKNAQVVDWDGLSSLYLKLGQKHDEWTKLLLTYFNL